MSQESSAESGSKTAGESSDPPLTETDIASSTPKADLNQTDQNSSEQHSAEVASDLPEHAAQAGRATQTGSPASRGGSQAQNPSVPLLPRVATGDPTAVQECITRYGGLVWSLARRLSPTEADAEDATQEIFLDLWQSAGRFDQTVAAETTFVAMIARRRLIDRSRKAGRRPDLQQLPETLPNPQEEGGPERIELEDEASRVAAAMTRLRPEQQRVLKMSIYQGLSHDQIAQALEMPLGTVKTHARRGLIKLRDLLKGSAADEVAL